jgi:membrane-bound lytic murein transglycosylase F
LKAIFASILLFFFIVLTTCIHDTQVNTKVHIDLKEIKKRGKIIAITNYNTIDYFIYQGQPLGFQFELLQSFAEYSGLQLEIIAANEMDDLTSKLLNGESDIVAVSMPITSEQSKYISFTDPLMQSRQVLVQRKPSNWKNLSASEISNGLINSPLEMGGKTIVVQKGSAYAQRLKNISSEIGKEIEVIEVPDDEEQLIQFVAGGEIDYTVCDERIAQVNQTYFPQLDVNTVISFPQNLAWGVRKNSKKLLEELNAWLVQYKNSTKLAIIYNKYFQNQWSAKMVNSDYFVLNSGHLSPYDEEIKKYSEELHWDWRLLASLIYQESNFNPSVKSYAGAYGLMQITTATAQRFGVDSAKSPSQNLKVGVMLLKWLDKKLGAIISDPNERIKFVLAAYNVGIGHVIDAQLLAKKYGKDMTKWDEVKEFLRNKSKPQYYNDPLVKFGYCGGVQTINYVSEIIGRFKHYKNITSRQ